MGSRRPDFVDFYREAKDQCLLAVLVSVGDPDTAQGLQAKLRADGVPASVTFIGQQNPACRPYPVPPGDLPSPPSSFRKPGLFPGPLSNVLGSPFNNPPDAAMVIHPSALPSGAGLQIAVMQGIPAGPAGPWPYPKRSGHPVVEVGLVKASPQCTGS